MRRLSEGHVGATPIVVDADIGDGAVLPVGDRLEQRHARNGNRFIELEQESFAASVGECRHRPCGLGIAVDGVEGPG